MDHLCYLCLVLSCSLVFFFVALRQCWERTDLLAFVCDVLLCFCHFPMRNPGSGVVLDCIDF